MIKRPFRLALNFCELYHIFLITLKADSHPLTIKFSLNITSHIISFYATIRSLLFILKGSI